MRCPWFSLVRTYFRFVMQGKVSFITPGLNKPSLKAGQTVNALQDPAKMAKSATFAGCTPRLTPRPSSTPGSFHFPTFQQRELSEVDGGKRGAEWKMLVAMKGARTTATYYYIFLVFPFKGASSGCLFCSASTPPFAQEKRTRCKSAYALPFCCSASFPLVLLLFPSFFSISTSSYFAYIVCFWDICHTIWFSLDLAYFRSGFHFFEKKKEEAPTPGIHLEPNTPIVPSRLIALSFSFIWAVSFPDLVLFSALAS